MNKSPKSYDHQGYPILDPDNVFERAERKKLAPPRKQFVRHGFSPTPNAGKKTYLTDWSARFASFESVPASDEEIDLWVDVWGSERNLNTGLACGAGNMTDAVGRRLSLIVVDIDVDTSTFTVNEIRELVDEYLGEGYFISQGKPPRVKLFFATTEPIEKFKAYFKIAGSVEAIDILGNGAQAACYGEHPDTGRPYTWLTENHPLNTPITFLPRIGLEDIQAFLGAVADKYDGFVEGTNEYGGGGSSDIVRDASGIVIGGRNRYVADLCREVALSHLRDGVDFAELNDAQIASEVEFTFTQTALQDKEYATPQLRAKEIKSRIRSSKRLAKRIFEKEVGEQAQNDAFNAIHKAFFDKLLKPIDIAACDTRPLLGTLGERYLTEVCKLPKPAWAWPSNVFWDEASNSIRLPLTEGGVERDYISYLYREGEFDIQPKFIAAMSSASEGAVFGRLAGTHKGRPVVVDNLTSGLTIWLATGREVIVTYQPAVDVLDKLPNDVIVVLTDTPKETTVRKQEHLTTKYKIAQARKAGKRFAQVYPFSIRRFDSSTILDTFLEGGTEAVKARIDYGDSFFDGRQNLSEATDLNDARGKTNASFVEFAERLESSDPILARLIKTDAGVGKTHTIIENLPRYAQGLSDTEATIGRIAASKDSGTYIVSMPTHKLINGAYKRFRERWGDQLDIRVYYGLEATHPETGESLCREIVEAGKVKPKPGEPKPRSKVHLAMEGKLDVTRSVCEAGCPFFEGCAFLAQRKAKAKIWIVTHDILKSRAIPKHFGDVRAVIIDEDPTEKWSSSEILPLDLLLKTVTPYDLYTRHGYRTRSFTFSDQQANRKALFDALADMPDGYVDNEALLEKIDGKIGWGALEQEQDRRVAVADPEDTPLTDNNRDLHWSVNLWKAVNMASPFKDQYNGYLYLKTDEQGVRWLSVGFRTAIGEGWRKRLDRNAPPPEKGEKAAKEPMPFLFMDATPTPLVLRSHFPDLDIVDTGRVEFAHTTVYQDTSASYGKTAYLPQSSADWKEALLEKGSKEASDEVAKRDQTAENKRNDLYAFLYRVGSQFLDLTKQLGSSRNFAVLNKQLRDELRNEAEGLDGLYEFLNHKNVRGIDEHNNAPLGVVVGRPLPPLTVLKNQLGATLGYIPRDVVEADYVTGEMVRYTSSGPIPAADTNYLENDLLRAFYDRSVTSEVEQGLARGRYTNRTEDNPGCAIVLGDMRLPFVVEEFSLTGNESPTDTMLARYGVATESYTQAAIAFPDLYESKRSCKAKWETYRENPAQAPDLKTFFGSYIENSPNRRFSYYIYRGKTAPSLIFDITPKSRSQRPFEVIVNQTSDAGNDIGSIEKKVYQFFGTGVSVEEVAICQTTGLRLSDIDQVSLRGLVATVAKERKVSISAIAREIGMTQANLSKWVNGVTKKLQLAKLASVLKWLGDEAIRLVHPKVVVSARLIVAASASEPIMISQPANDATNDNAPKSAVCEVAKGNVIELRPARAKVEARSGLQANPPVFRATGTLSWPSVKDEQVRNESVWDLDLNNAPILPTYAPDEIEFGFFFNLNNAPVLTDQL